MYLDCLARRCTHGEAAARSARRRAEGLADLKEDAIHRLKRRPLNAMGAAFAVGTLLGLVVAGIALLPRRND